MKFLAKEIEANFDAFRAQLPTELTAARVAIEKHRDVFLSSYTGVATLQAWRTELLESALPSDPLGFYLEAQNDALSSHSLATMGMHRSALQSMRSCIENTLQSLYYMDHPIECMLWQQNKHRNSRTDLEKYFSTHPNLQDLKANITGISILSKQYSLLNHGVHASAKSFRMTRDQTGILVFSPDQVRLRQWASSEGDVLRGINLLLLSMFRVQLSGNSLPNLRKTISLIFDMKMRNAIRLELGVLLPVP